MMMITEEAIQKELQQLQEVYDKNFFRYEGGDEDKVRVSGAISALKHVLGEYTPLSSSFITKKKR